MKKVEKKVWPEYFQEILNGKKTFELRLNDFDIAEGDIEKNGLQLISLK